jgi:hypothetical protein
MGILILNEVNSLADAPAGKLFIPSAIESLVTPMKSTATDKREMKTVSIDRDTNSVCSPATPSFGNNPYFLERIDRGHLSVS